MEESWPVSVRLQTRCLHKSECKFGDGCLATKSADEGARFAPVLRVRMIDLRTQIRCFSFQAKGERNGRKSRY